MSTDIKSTIIGIQSISIFGVLSQMWGPTSVQFTKHDHMSLVSLGSMFLPVFNYLNLLFISDMPSSVGSADQFQNKWHAQIGQQY